VTSWRPTTASIIRTRGSNPAARNSQCIIAVIHGRGTVNANPIHTSQKTRCIRRLHADSFIGRRLGRTLESELVARCGRRLPVEGDPFVRAVDRASSVGRQRPPSPANRAFSCQNGRPSTRPGGSEDYSDRRQAWFFLSSTPGA